RTAQQVDEERDNILRDMLSLADHLEMALQHWDQLQDPETQKDFRASLEATLAAFLDTLQRYGVQPMNPVGEPFDPNLHEAVGHVPSDGIPPDHVAQVVRTGYTVNGRLLRPARVLVSSGPA
ncbi:MAG: nucleotide exchange factor GrpE, partial [Caldilineae bacterium]